MKKFLAVIVILMQINLFAQVTDSIQIRQDSVSINKDTLEEAPDQSDTTFRIKEIKITGTSKYSKNQIMRYTGLYEGDPVDIPGMQKIV